MSELVTQELLGAISRRWSANNTILLAERASVTAPLVEDRQLLGDIFRKATSLPREIGCGGYN